MLIDEADAFMMKRDEADLIEQKAMVSGEFGLGEFPKLVNI